MGTRAEKRKAKQGGYVGRTRQFTPEQERINALPLVEKMAEIRRIVAKLEDPEEMPILKSILGKASAEMGLDLEENEDG